MPRFLNYELNQCEYLANFVDCKLDRGSTQGGVAVLKVWSKRLNLSSVGVID